MKPRTQLIVCGFVLCAWCVVLTIQSFRFTWGSPLADRPTLTFVAGMIFATVVSLLALKAAIRCRRSAGLTKLILGPAILMRILLIPSHPVMELDIYRYMWDGLVTTETGNPWQFSPALVRETARDSGPDKLQQLTELRDSSAGISTTLNRIHYAKLTTIYPPVSQAVFAASAWITPHQASARARLMVTRFVITVFDVLTILAMLKLLTLMGKPPGWSICYAWSPLVLKEFANSGHLDAIAVCLCMWSIVFCMTGLRRQSVGRVVTAATLLGLAIGAKLYPVVLTPLVAVSVWRKMDRRTFALSGLVLAAVTTCSLWPMLTDRLQPASATPDSVVNTQDNTEVKAEHLQTGAGLDQFLQRWRINHFFFQIIEENLTPRSSAWFAVTPVTFRQQVTQRLSTPLHVSDRQSAFLITRSLTTLFFLGILWALCRKIWLAQDSCLLQATFLALAWFFLLLPTMNPWYWIWAMPLLPFARHRAWLLLSGCVCIYYVRFWLTNSLGQPHVPGTHYSGHQFFQYVVVWLEYLPWFCLLIIEWQRRRTKKAS